MSLFHPALSQALTVMGLLIVGGIVPLPRPLLCIGAGAALGWAALLPTMAGSAVGSALGFALARSALRDPARRMIARRPRVQSLLHAIEAEGWRVLGPLRLASPVPGPAINVACGVSGMGFGEYIVTTVVGILPQTVLYIALGLTGSEALANPSLLSLHGLVAVAGMALTAGALWRLKRSAGRRSAGPPPA